MGQFTLRVMLLFCSETVVVNILSVNKWDNVLHLNLIVVEELEIIFTSLSFPVTLVIICCFEFLMKKYYKYKNMNCWCYTK